MYFYFLFFIFFFFLLLICAWSFYRYRHILKSGNVNFNTDKVEALDYKGQPVILQCSARYNHKQDQQEPQNQHPVVSGTKNVSNPEPVSPIEVVPPIPVSGGNDTEFAHLGLTQCQYDIILQLTSLLQTTSPS